MASFRLGRFFSQPEILRGIDPENLLSLFAVHAKAPEALGFALSDADAAASIDYDGIASLLMEPDKLPHLQLAFITDPKKFDVLVLNPVEGELHIKVRNKAEKKEYRKVSAGSCRRTTVCFAARASAG